MRGLALLVALAGACGAAPDRAAGPSSCDAVVEHTSVEAFTRSAERILACQLPDARIDGGERLRLIVDTRGSGGRYEIALHKPWRQCLATKLCDQALRQHLDAFVATVRSPVEDSPAALRAVVRSRRFVDATRARSPGLLVEPLVADLAVLLVIDTPRTMVYVDERGLGALGLSRAQAFARGRRNVAAALGPVDALIQDLPANGLGVLRTASGYDPSRLLEPAAWAAVAARFHGALLVSAPASDALLYVDGSQPQAAAALAAVTADIVAKAPQPLSATVLRWTPTGWVPASP
jgi:hypothetical protein